MADDDASLTRRVVAGDRGAARELAQRLLPRVRRVVSALVGARGRDRHEDLVQSCMLEVLRSVKRFEGRSALETWATSIAVRHTLKQLRRERSRSAWVVDDADPEVAAAPSASERLAESLPRPIEDYLEMLPEIHRVAIVLRGGFGYSLEEIATMTGASANTVKARLRNAKLKLRALVVAERGEEAES